MYELTRIIPDAEVLLALEPEELGAKILFVLRKRTDSNSNRSQQALLLSNLLGELWPGTFPYTGHGQQPYPPQRREEINLAISEAWAWLTAQGLLVPSPTASASGHDWRVLSRRAYRFENEAEFTRFAFARILPKDALHSRISNTVWSAFMRGEFDVAAFQAMKAVEVAVREASGLPQDLLGVKLMRKAFDPKDGPLTDVEADEGEKEAAFRLFCRSDWILQESPFSSRCSTRRPCRGGGDHHAREPPSARRRR
jgi:hypothetical protein